MDDSRQTPHLRFRALWLRYERLVRWRCLLAARGNVERACDFVQEVALRLIQSCDALHADEQLPSERVWVLRIVRSTLRDVHASIMPVHDIPLDDRWADDTRDAELNQTLDDFAADLSDDERRFLQYYRDGFDIGEIAVIYSLSYDAAAKRLAAIRQKLTLRARQQHYIR